MVCWALSSSRFKVWTSEVELKLFLEVRTGAEDAEKMGEAGAWTVVGSACWVGV